MKVLAIISVLIVCAPICYGSDSKDCVDKSKFCPNFAKQCINRVVQTRCPKMCNTCEGGSGSGYPKMCGLSKVQQSRVIGGKDAKPGAWPWQVAMFRDVGLGPNFYRFTCGGSLISPTWVVTAAHCVDRQQASQLKVLIGANYLRSAEGSEQIHSVRRAIMHPGYGNLNNDIALLQLDTPARFNERVQPVCMPKKGEAPAIGSKCYLTGWGKIKHPGGSHPILQQVPLAIQDSRKCNSINGKYVGITKQMLCAANPGTKQMGCHGDSGGPLVCQQPNGSWKLQGAVSWGSPKCDANDAWTVFARVAEFRDWIDSYVL